METKEAIEAVIKEDGIDAALEWIAGVVDEKHSRIEALEKALRKIVDCCTLPAQNDFEMREIARAALEGKD